MLLFFVIQSGSGSWQIGSLGGEAVWASSSLWSFQAGLKEDRTQQAGPRASAWQRVQKVRRVFLTCAHGQTPASMPTTKGSKKDVRKGRRPKAPTNYQDKWAMQSREGKGGRAIQEKEQEGPV